MDAARRSGGYHLSEEISRLSAFLRAKVARTISLITVIDSGEEQQEEFMAGKLGSVIIHTCPNAIRAGARSYKRLFPMWR